MRRLWPEGDEPDSEFFLNSEVDKRNHPDFDDAPKPDFLVHVPGRARNDAVIEVKPPDPSAGQIRTDIEKLIGFREYGYEQAIYLIFGCSLEHARTIVCGAVPDEATLQNIDLFVHHTCGEPAVSVDLI